MRWPILLIVAAVLSEPVVGCGGTKSANEDACRQALQPYLAALKDLNSRLSVGVTYNDYGERVGDIAVAHDNVQWDDNWDEKCSDARSAADFSFAAYRRAGQFWQACITKLSCKVKDDPKIQVQWLAAQEKLNSAESLLNPTTGKDTTSSSTTTTEATTTSGSATTPSFASSKCRALGTAAAKIGQDFSSASQGGGSIEDAAEEFQAFVNVVPSEIRGDVRTIADAISTYAKALKGINFTPGQTPSAADLQKIQGAVAKLDQSKLQAASKHIDDWVKKNC